ncbi:hypothetical protein O6H91_03G010700 [Diphasiastrum complanatum]|uniref:Uncharacterized protein n=1 Tax=Diphasiastrum complanatum TaxID=34168 RepID=A0ACC2E373_DIPCM|nr:hypothetical protein O6H91_Y429200 [Diphasiastrum complanatum]KAJ7561013.1 hypothetical protein O6H91_03G010700 [Diphasiastrum complanatum]
MIPMGKLLLLAFFLIVLSTATTAFESTAECENLDRHSCAYSVSSLGLRCVLEQYPSKSGYLIYECQTSSVMAVFRGPWIETDECLASCGLERMTVGISSDGLEDRSFMAMLCSPTCVENCVNIIDLYSNLAADEGINLRQICKLFIEPGMEALIPVIPLGVDRTNSVIEGWTQAEAPTSAPSNQYTPSAEPQLPY